MKRTFEQHSVNKFGKVSLESKSNSPGWPPCKFSNRPTSVAYCRHVWLSPRMPNLNMTCLSQTFRWSRCSLQSRACPQPVDSCSHVSGGCYQSGKEFMQLLCTTPLLCLSAMWCSTISRYFHVQNKRMLQSKTNCFYSSDLRMLPVPA